MIKRRSISMNIFVLFGIILAISVYILFAALDFLRLTIDGSIFNISGYEIIGIALHPENHAVVSDYLVSNNMLNVLNAAGLFSFIGLILTGLYLAGFALNLFGILSKYVRFYFVFASLAALCMFTASVLNFVLAQSLKQATLGIIPGIAVLVSAAIAFVKESPFPYTQTPENYLP